VLAATGRTATQIPLFLGEISLLVVRAFRESLGRSFSANEKK